ncbi:MAG TPA: SRPBCC family protein [Thermomonospora sp.]|nr:SRPBCC family protein [Thermomonospora sp.]
MDPAGTLEIADDRYAVRFERRLAHPVDRVWRAVTEPAQLAEWFPSNLELEPRTGGTVRQSFPGGMEMPPGTVTAYEPPRLLEFVESSEGLPLAGAGDDRGIRVELAPDGDGTVLVFVNTFGDRAGAASFATGWHTCLDALEMVLDGKPVTVPDDYATLHERYVDSFGPPDGSAEQGPGGWTVRFVRQLPYPKGATWAALTGADPEDPASAGLAPGDVVPEGLTGGLVTGGSVAEIDPPGVVEYRAQADGGEAGTVRWEMLQGPGGARILLTHTLDGTLADRRTAVLAGWHDRLERLAAELGGDERPRSPRRIDELTEYYTART